MSKTAILLFADSESHADLGRVANALEITKEFAEGGDDTVLIFDGAGTTWVPKLNERSHPLNGLYISVKKQIRGACSFCAKSFGVKEGVEKAGTPLLEKYDGHPSVKRLADEGYRIITL